MSFCKTVASKTWRNTKLLVCVAWGALIQTTGQENSILGRNAFFRGSLDFKVYLWKTTQKSVEVTRPMTTALQLNPYENEYSIFQRQKSVDASRVHCPECSKCWQLQIELLNCDRFKQKREIVLWMEDIGIGKLFWHNESPTACQTHFWLHFCNGLHGVSLRFFVQRSQIFTSVNFPSGAPQWQANVELARRFLKISRITLRIRVLEQCSGNFISRATAQWHAK